MKRNHRFQDGNGMHLLKMVLTLAALCFAGCGGPQEDRPELQAVQGTMTINGQPPAGAMLVFHPAEDFDPRGTRPRATVQEDGQFSVTTYLDGDGIPAGEYDVTVLWFDNPDASSPHDKLGGRYATPEKTGLHVTIKEGQSEIDPLAIDGARLVPRHARSSTPDFDGID